MANPPDSGAAVTADHRRQWRNYLYVYPVVSRRSKGLSVGVNLNLDKRCTYSCIYCQIDRTVAHPHAPTDLSRLHRELEEVLMEATSGTIWREERFAATPAPLRRLNDIAFSGDGEPTCLPDFDAAVSVAATVKSAMRLPGVKIVVITNAAHLRSRQFQAALPILDAHNGEIWAKLDAGTEGYFARVNRPAAGLTLAQVVKDITAVARGRGIVIQSLFDCEYGRPPAPQEIAAYAKRLDDIVAGGGKIKLVQIHTVARPPAEPNVSALSDVQLRTVAEQVRQVTPKLTVETYPGSAFTAPPAT